MTPESQYLRDLANGIVSTYGDIVAPRAVLLTGSSALGDSDRYSDLDLIFYHDSIPSHVACSTACLREHRTLGFVGHGMHTPYTVSSD